MPVKLYIYMILYVHNSTSTTVPHVLQWGCWTLGWWILWWWQHWFWCQVWWCLECHGCLPILAERSSPSEVHRRSKGLGPGVWLHSRAGLPKQMCWVFPLWLPLMNLGLEYLDTLVSHRPLISFDGFVILTPTVSQNVAKRCHILMPLPFRCQGGLAGFAWEGGKVIRWSSGRSGWCDTEQQGKRRIQDAKVLLAALFWLEWLKNEHVNVYVLRLCYVCSV